MTAPYVRYLADWKNKPDFSTPITAEAIEHIETGIINAPTVPINIDDTGIAAFLKTTSLTQHTATLWQAAIAGSGVALNVVSDNPDASAMYLSGIDSGTGTLKITHRKPGVADANASALSIDLQDGVGFGGSAAQGIFLTATEGATTGNLLCLRNNSRDDFVVKGTGRVGIGLAIGATPAGELEIHQTDVANIGLAITALASGTHMLMLKDSGGNPRFEVGNSGSMVARAVAFFTSSLQVGASSADLGGGAGVISIKDATTVPTTNPFCSLHSKMCHTASHVFRVHRPATDEPRYAFPTHDQLLYIETYVSYQATVMLDVPVASEPLSESVCEPGFKNDLSSHDDLLSLPANETPAPLVTDPAHGRVSIVISTPTPMLMLS